MTAKSQRDDITIEKLRCTTEAPKGWNCATPAGLKKISVLMRYNNDNPSGLSRTKMYSKYRL